MNISRRNFLAGAGAIGVSAAVGGCHTLPTEDTMRRIGTAFGGATGLVLEQFDVDPDVRNTIITIVGKCRGVAPQDGETVWDAWMKAARNEVADLVTAGKLTKTQGELVLVAFELVVKGLQLLVEKHQEIGTYCGLTVAAIGGFCDGFLAAYKPANAAAAESVEVDAAAYGALRRSREAYRLQAIRPRAYPSRNMK